MALSGWWWKASRPLRDRSLVFVYSCTAFAEQHVIRGWMPVHRCSQGYRHQSHLAEVFRKAWCWISGETSPACIPGKDKNNCRWSAYAGLSCKRASYFLPDFQPVRPRNHFSLKQTERETSIDIPHFPVHICFCRLRVDVIEYNDPYKPRPVCLYPSRQTGLPV